MARGTARGFCFEGDGMQHGAVKKYLAILTAAAAAIAVALPAARTLGQSPVQRATKDVKTADIPESALRSRAEEIYSQLREALYNKDYDTFMALTIPAGKGKPPPKEVFDQIAFRLGDDYPVLESLNFVKLDRSGDWVGYYAEDRVSDAKRTYIFMFRFKRVGEDLKMYGRVVHTDIPRVKRQFSTMDEIALNPIFRLPGQKGFKE
jgi:hypothetical protein